MFGGLVDGARVWHAEYSGAEVRLRHPRHVCEVLMFEGLFSSNAFSGVVGEEAVEKVD